MGADLVREVLPATPTVAGDPQAGAGFTVLVADDDEAIHVILGDTLRYWGHRVVAVADGAAALQAAGTLDGAPFDVAFVDVVMPGPSGMALAQALWKVCSWLQVVLITAYGDTQLAVESMYHGACAYLDKPFHLSDVEAAMGKAAARLAQLPCGWRALTARERELLPLLAGGYSDAEIGAQLGLSPRTVSNHIHRILAKLRATNRAQVAALWARCTYHHS